MKSLKSNDDDSKRSGMIVLFVTINAHDGEPKKVWDGYRPNARLERLNSALVEDYDFQ